MSRSKHSQKRKLKPTAGVYSDGLACIAAVINRDCSHTLIVSGGGRKSVENPTFKWVNTTLGNISQR